jgi:hypothetical protein
MTKTFIFQGRIDGPNVARLQRGMILRTRVDATGKNAAFRELARRGEEAGAGLVDPTLVEVIIAGRTLKARR